MASPRGNILIFDELTTISTPSPHPDRAITRHDTLAPSARLSDCMPEPHDQQVQIQSHQNYAHIFCPRKTSPMPSEPQNCLDLTATELDPVPETFHNLNIGTSILSSRDYSFMLELHLSENLKGLVVQESYQRHDITDHVWAHLPGREGPWGGIA